MEAFVHGVSTRKVDDLVGALGIDARVSKSQVVASALTSTPRWTSSANAAWTTVEFPYVFLDATVRHETPYDRVGWKDPPSACRSRPMKLEAA